MNRVSFSEARGVEGKCWACRKLSSVLLKITLPGERQQSPQEVQEKGRGVLGESGSFMRLHYNGRIW